MEASDPPVLATKLLERLVSGPYGDAVAGDLVEQYRAGRPASWFWRQALMAIAVSFAKDRMFGGLAILAWLFLAVLMMGGAIRYPSSIEGAGGRLLTTDLALLLAYGAFSVWAWRQRRSVTRDALTGGARAGLILGLTFIANHAIETFTPLGNRTADLVRGPRTTPEAPRRGRPPAPRGRRGSRR